MRLLIPASKLNLDFYEPYIYLTGTFIPKITNHIKNDPFCPLVKVAENVISKGVRFININGSSSKCFCPTCYQQRNDSNHLFKGKNSDTGLAYRISIYSGFVKFYITQINKNNAELKYQSLSSGKSK